VGEKEEEGGEGREREGKRRRREGREWPAPKYFGLEPPLISTAHECINYYYSA